MQQDDSIPTDDMLVNLLVRKEKSGRNVFEKIFFHRTRENQADDVRQLGICTNPSHSVSSRMLGNKFMMAGAA